MGSGWIIHRWKPGKTRNVGSKRWVLPPPPCDFTGSSRGKSILHHIICWEENVSHPNKFPRQGDDNTLYNGDSHCWESQTKRVDETFSVCSKAAPIFVTIQSQCAFPKWQTGKESTANFEKGIDEQTLNNSGPRGSNLAKLPALGNPERYRWLLNAKREVQQDREKHLQSCRKSRDPVLSPHPKRFWTWTSCCSPNMEPIIQGKPW